MPMAARAGQKPPPVGGQKPPRRSIGAELAMGLRRLAAWTRRRRSGQSIPPPDGTRSSPFRTLRIRESEEVRAEVWRLDETAKVVYHGSRPSEDRLIAASLLRGTFPSVPPERLRKAADVLVEAMSGCRHGANPERLDLAAMTIADVFASE
jgi:hypothetical protein